MEGCLGRWMAKLRDGVGGWRYGHGDVQVPLSSVFGCSLVLKDLQSTFLEKLCRLLSKHYFTEGHGGLLTDLNHG